MAKRTNFPQRVFVAKDCQALPLAQKVLDALSQHCPVKCIDHPQEAIEEIKIARDPIKEGKTSLLVMKQKGSYVKPCPCTPRYIGCNYFIINADLNCPLDCTYCILQLYLTNPLLTIHADTEQLYTQLDDFLHKNRGRRLRIGTGELGDSLALDPLTHRSRDLISYFSDRPKALFELKTKTVNIENLMNLCPNENIVVAWSLNSDKMAREEEKGAPSVRERIEAAGLVSEAGFRVAFHFDPIIFHPGWKKGYTEVVRELLSRINPHRIAWMSLGSLRFHPELRPVIRKRFPQSKIIYQEFIKGRDGKYRYLKSLRVGMYRTIVDAVKKWGGSKIPLYFCMESGDIWKDVLKKTPRGKKEVEGLLTLPLGGF